MQTSCSSSDDKHEVPIPELNESNIEGVWEKYSNGDVYYIQFKKDKVVYFFSKKGKGVIIYNYRLDAENPTRIFLKNSYTKEEQEAGINFSPANDSYKLLFLPKDISNLENYDGYYLFVSKEL